MRVCSILSWYSYGLVGKYGSRRRMYCPDIMKMAFMSIGLVSASFGTTVLNTPAELAISSESAALSTQNRNRYASIGSAIGHATSGLWLAAMFGFGEGTSKCQGSSRDSSRLERLDTEPGAGLVCRQICDGGCHALCVASGTAGTSDRPDPASLVGRARSSLVLGDFLVSSCAIFLAVLERAMCFGAFLLSALPGFSNSSATSVDSSTKSSAGHLLTRSTQYHSFGCTYSLLVYQPTSVLHRRSSRTS